MNQKLDRISGLALILLAVYVIIHTLVTLPLGNHFHPGSGYVPLLLALLLAILGAIIFFKGTLDMPFSSVEWPGMIHVLVIMGCCVFSILAFERIGYRATTSIILLVLFGLIERLRIWQVLVLTFGFSFGSYWVFNSLLKVPLPQWSLF